MASLKQKNKQLINEMNAFVKQQRHYMNQLQIEDDRLVSANRRLLQLQEDVEKEGTMLKNSFSTTVWYIS